MPDANAIWQRKATEAYNATQDKIPVEWRIPSDLLAPAWVDKDDFVVAPEFKLDVRAVPRQSGILTPDECTIIDTDAIQIVDKIKAGQWTALAVTTG